MAYEYVAYNEAGDRVAGTLEVESPERAQEVLWASNLIILRLRKHRKRPTLAQLMPTFFGVKPLDIITFTRELASLLEAGIALLPSLRVLHEQVEKTALKDAIRSVMQDVETGNSFSQACAKQPSVFPPFYTRLLQVAEQTGELRKILLEIVAYMERQRVAVAKVMKALTYPAIVLAVGIVAAFILITFTVPSLTGLLAEYGAKIPLATQVLVAVGKIGERYGMRILAALVILSLLGWQYRRTPAGKKRWDSTILKLPVIGKIIRQSQMARLCSSLTTLLSAGIPTAEAIYLSIEATENSVFREGLSQVYQEVLTGSRLEPAILRQSIFPRLFAQTVGIGEETGALKVNLDGLTTFYEQETDRAIARATDMIEPTIIIVIGLVVGYIGIAVISTIYSILPQIR